MFVVMVLVGLWHGANWTFVAWGAYHGLLLIGYRLFDRAKVGTAIDRVMKKRWFVPFSIGAMVTAFVLGVPFFRPKTFQTSGHVLSALFGFQHMTGEFLLTTGTIVLISFLCFWRPRANGHNSLIAWLCSRRVFKSRVYVARF
jgi:D-alanyl-lipoteichoic acid acyltransferase DltB (MBOAT superfamily)